MQKALLILSLLAISSLAVQVDLEEVRTLWHSWKNQHGKVYGVEAEEQARFAIFVENFKYIQKFNAEDDSVKLALNKFADLTGEEFKNKHSRCAFYNDNEEFVKAHTAPYTPIDAPTSVDWRQKGAVTPVKNQQQCGSCWAFSTTGSLEGYYFINNNKLVSFSEQQLVDCDTGDEGCNGGLMSQALEYTATAGIETEDNYPYIAQDQKCAYKKTQAIAVNKGYAYVTPKSADALKTALVNQPVAVAIEADQQVFQFYNSGVIKKGCGAGLDHGVLAVGYDTVSGAEAFIVKNSWGEDWGQQGYVYISTDARANRGQGVCGILAQPTIPN